RFRYAPGVTKDDGMTDKRLSFIVAALELLRASERLERLLVTVLAIERGTEKRPCFGAISIKLRRAAKTALGSARISVLEQGAPQPDQALDIVGPEREPPV